MKEQTRHTPGPWDVHGDHATLVGPRNGKQMLAEAKHGHIVTECALTIGEAQANARLIAAAPELLEALKAMLNGGIDTGLTWEETCNQAAAAIAKAEGNAVL